MKKILSGSVIALLVQENIAFVGHLEAQGSCRQHLGFLWILGTALMAAPDVE